MMDYLLRGSKVYDWYRYYDNYMLIWHTPVNGVVTGKVTVVIYDGCVTVSVVVVVVRDFNISVTTILSSLTLSQQDVTVFSKSLKKHLS